MKTFKQTSDKPYDRHEYKLVLKNGKSITVDDYELVGHCGNTTDSRRPDNVIDITVVKGSRM